MVSGEATHLLANKKTIKTNFNMVFISNRCLMRTFYVCLGVVGIAFITVFFIIPFVFRLFPDILKSFIFVPDEEIPESLDFNHPEKAGFIGGRNFYLKTEDGAMLGVWHTLPVELEEEARNLNPSELDAITLEETYDKWLSHGTVFLYLHGSAGTRLNSHRLRVYKLLNQLNYHVITFDYRGYGDSSSKPTGEADLVTDTKTVFTWIKEKVKDGKIYFWGHSLGTGVASHVADDLLAKGEDEIHGLILEAPFNNMAGAVRVNPLAEAISFLPWFEYCFIEPLKGSDMAFENDKHLKNISILTLILHAKDDKIVPEWMAEELYKEVSESRKDKDSIKLVTYDKNLHYGHYNISLDPGLGETIREFVKVTGGV